MSTVNHELNDYLSRHASLDEDYTVAVSYTHLTLPTILRV